MQNVNPLNLHPSRVAESLLPMLSVYVCLCKYMCTSANDKGTLYFQSSYRCAGVKVCMVVFFYCRNIADSKVQRNLISSWAGQEGVGEKAVECNQIEWKVGWQLALC